MDIRHEETALEMPGSTPHGPWPDDSLARVPYWIYQDEANYKREMQRLFEAATWNFVCLEADIPNKGDYRTNHVGVLPVIVVRGADGTINCFENRCAHRGALIAFDDGGNVQNTSSASTTPGLRPCRQPARHRLRRGINGLEVAQDFRREDFSPQARTTTLGGLVFATLSPIRRHRGLYRQRVLGRFRRVLNRPIRVMGARPCPVTEALCRELRTPTTPACHLFLTTFASTA
jgi:anthranilate 1,2-dioxygenase large subunit/terephthalate 1,2-dioxygenase oxygenase component alpha subunit